MFFVEYTENNERKALNLAMCQTIETQVNRTSAKSSYCLFIRHQQYGNKAIEFETEEELLSTFDSLMNAIKTYQGHWMSPQPLHDVSSRS